MKKVLKKYVRKRARNLKGLLEAAKFSDDPELFHQIRLEVKKLKAVLELFYFADPSFPIRKTFIPLRTIFREAGNIREPSELSKLLLHYTTDSATVNLSKKPSQKLLLSFKKKIPRLLKGLKKTKNKILERSEGITKKKIQKYLARQDKKIERKLYPTLKTFTLHRTRKLIKELIYLSSMGKSNINISPFFSKSAETIGHWHDKQLVVQLLMTDKTTHKNILQTLQESCDQDLQHLNQLASDHYTLQ